MNHDSRQEQHSQHYRVLSIAGSDSGGGAGIQADIKTCSALGCYGMSVITALTAQNTRGVMGIHAVPEDFVKQQMEAVLSDIGVDAVKIGMLYSPALIETVAATLSEFKISKIVLDPVMVAQSGDKLLRDDAIDAIKTVLMPIVDLITPNLPEASVILNRPIETTADFDQALTDLAAFGCPNVLIKGGHLEGRDSNDYLYLGSRKEVVTFEGKRIDTRNNHGTGCTLSSAIASYLARGEDMETAVAEAKTYITGAIQAGAAFKIGEGHGPVHHFFNLWQS